MNLDFRNILFIDIETVGCAPSYQELDERIKKEWDRKSRFLLNHDVMSSEELFNDRAGIYAEFGKIITIGIGTLHEIEENKLGLRVKAISGHDEKEILLDLKQLLETKFDQKNLALCAHNGREFDFPYLIRRMLVNDIELPETLMFQNKKPWEIIHIDTMDLWKFGDRKSFTSLELLAALFGIESSKESIDGSMVNATYYLENDLEKISNYCKQDIIVTAQVFLKLKSLPAVADENISII